MLKRITLEGVGPASRLEFRPARRFNLIAGDNGLGKSFLLEASWYALTRTWHEQQAVPTKSNAKIGYSFDGSKKVETATAKWDPKGQHWKRRAGRPSNPGLVLYARVDGSFSVWDPMRNYRLYTRADGGEAESPEAYRFSGDEVMEGLTRRVVEGGRQREQVLCSGLIDDWTRWQAANDPRFEMLETILGDLGPDEQPLVPGKPYRPTLDDQREIPTIRMPYDQDVPLTYAPAGVRRIVKLAYLFTWALSEHATEADRIGQPKSDQIILLFDEPETHLHPRWQRTILPSLTAEFARHPQADVQTIVATHSPLVLASMEDIFDEKTDALWKLDLMGQDVALERDDWHKRGDVNRWLTSDVFDLGAARSREAEAAINRAVGLVHGHDLAELQEVDDTLNRVLPEFDPFLIRWRHTMRDKLEQLQHDTSH